MKTKDIIALTLLLIFVSSMFVIFNGDKYIATIDCLHNGDKIEDVEVTLSDDCIKCTGKKIVDGKLELKLESEHKGKTFIEVKVGDEDRYLNSAYVRGFGGITYGNFFGDFTGDKMVPTFFSIILLNIIIKIGIIYKKNLKENIYQYKNILYAGLLVFLVFSFINQFLSIFTYNGAIDTVNRMLGIFSLQAIVFLPFSLIIWIFVAVSNVVLIVKEGFKIRNLFGFIWGLTIAVLTLVPHFLNNFLQTTTLVDVHNEQGIWLYVQLLIENTIFIMVSYLECILVGTIILGIRAAKHIPEFDKDYIMILGCKIRKDGTLTNLLKSRVDRAIEFRNMQLEKNGKDLVFVPSGGKGSDETISESEAMKNYLLEKGINEKNILCEQESTNTFENIKYSNKIISEKNDNAKISFSTTNYHVFRAGVLADEQNIRVEGIGAKTKTYFWINAFIREFTATLYSQRKKHLLFILFLLLSVISMIVIKYYSAIL